MKNRFVELDAMRCVAAVMVVLYHYSTWYVQSKGYSSTVPLFSFEGGRYGVHLFFIISGFFIFLTLNKTEHFLDFVASRFARLYPAYWTAVFLIFACVFVFLLPDREVSILSALFNLTMLQGWFGIRNVDGVFWTLAVELVFYSLMMIFCYLKMLERINLVSTIWLILILGAGILSASENIEIGRIVRLFLLLEYGSLFIMGIMFFKIMTEKNKASFGIALLALIVDMYIRPESAGFVIGYFMIFTIFAMGGLSIIAIKPLVFLGAISYSLYLIHQNIGYLFIRGLEVHDMANSVTVILVPLLMSILIATLMTFFVERSSMLFIRNKWYQSKLRNRVLEDKSEGRLVIK